MKEMIRRFREKLRKGFVLGPFAKTGDPAFIEILGHAGFDFVIIDLEHAPNSVQTVQGLIRGAELAGLAPIVRVKEDNLSVIGEVLDIGAAGVQAPQIESAEAARRVVKAAKFAPLGERGVCRFVRAARYSAQDRFRYFKEANEALVIVQIEGRRGIRNLRSILGVKGIDAVFVGPYDLSQSLGVAGQVGHARVVGRMKEIAGECRKRGVAVGTFVETAADAAKWRKLGVRYLSYSVDVGMFYDKCRDVVAECRSRIEKKKGE